MRAPERHDRGPNADAGCDWRQITVPLSNRGTDAAELRDPGIRDVGFEIRRTSDDESTNEISLLLDNIVLQDQPRGRLHAESSSFELSATRTEGFPRGALCISPAFPGLLRIHPRNMRIGIRFGTVTVCLLPAKVPSSSPCRPRLVVVCASRPTPFAA